MRRVLPQTVPSSSAQMQRPSSTFPMDVQSAQMTGSYRSIEPSKAFSVFSAHSNVVRGLVGIPWGRIGFTRWCVPSEEEETS